MKRTIGIDYSTTRIHIAQMNEQGVERVSFIDLANKWAEKEWSKESLARIEAHFLTVPNDFDIVCIEEPIYIQNGDTHMKLVSVATVLQIKAVETGFQTFFVNNRAWKRLILDKGNADKKASIEHVVSQLNWPTKDHNEADAICIAEYALQIALGHRTSKA